MTNDPRWIAIRCAKCGTKMGEHCWIRSGSIQILCKKNKGHGAGTCNTMNTITVDNGNIQQTSECYII